MIKQREASLVCLDKVKEVNVTLSLGSATSLSSPHEYGDKESCGKEAECQNSVT